MSVDITKYQLSEDNQCATVLDHTFHVGSMLPFINTAGKESVAQITSFKRVENGKIWFTGINVVTNKEVWYPVHKSIDILRKYDLLPTSIVQLKAEYEEKINTAFLKFTEIIKNAKP